MEVTGAVVGIVAALISAFVVLYTHRLGRKNEVESHHAAAREAAYDRLIAAVDAAWFYRTQKALPSEDSGDDDVSSGAAAANELFQNGWDMLKSHSKDFDARIPLLSSWYTTAFENTHTVPQGFESARDAMVNLGRRESGLRRQLEDRHDLSFFERLLSGHQVQRLPIGLEQIIRTTDDEIIISGGGENFIQIMLDAANYQNELRDSRERARMRLRDWQNKNVWRPPEKGGEP